MNRMLKNIKWMLKKHKMDVKKHKNKTILINLKPC